MIKAGIIGLGDHFLEHILGSIREAHEIQATVICDIDTKKIDHARLYFPDASTTTEWQEVFEADVDIIICVSYPQLHEGIIEWGIKYNKPVFVEKPPFISGKAIAKLAKLKDLHNYKMPVGVGINFNFSTMAEVVKNIIDSGEYGSVIEVDICHLSNKPDKDIWELKNPLQTMMLAQAIHPLSLMTMFMDDLGADNFCYIVTEQNEQAIVKMILSGSKEGKPVSGSIRTGSFGPRFLFHMSVTFESGARMECTPERIHVYDGKNQTRAGSNKWLTTWESKPFLSGIERGGYVQELTAFLEAVRTNNDSGVYDPRFFEDIYKIIDGIVEGEKARK
ncbi:MAG: Gfo/Idh/MocA family oxidoreductase [Candidatus Saccharimonadales bacterium]